MSYQFQFFNEVLIDIQEAKFWYKKQKEGLEIEFAKAVENTISQILKMPTAYAIRYKIIRIAHTKVFPYNIHFYIDEPNQLVVITAIVHNKRHLNVASKRI